MELPLPHVAGVEHRYARVNGIRVHYAEAGQGEPIVLVHGWPQHWWMWRQLFGPLAERFRVICPDLRGFGWSDAPEEGYLKAQLADDLVALLDELDLDRVRLVGHDWGAYVGFLVCLDHPARVSRFVALSITHLWPPPGPPDWKLLRRAWYQLVLAAPVVGKLSVGRFDFARTALKTARAVGAYSRDELDTYTDVLRQPGHPQASMQMYRSFLLHELRPLLGGHYRTRRLETPTLLLIGERDPLRRGAGPGYERYADDMTVEVVPAASHFLPEERPEVVLERLLDFLA